MSNSILADGKGTGNKAEVDDHGRLATKAVIVGHMSHHATYHKNAYQATFETTLADANEAACAFLCNNTGTEDIEIYHITVSSNADCEINVRVRETHTSGGVVTVPVNTNLSSNIGKDVTAYEGGPSADLVLGTTRSEDFNGEFIGAYRPYEHNYEGALVLTPNTCVSFYGKATASDRVKITISYAFHPAGTKL